jgi:hypothetical protein
MTEERSGSSLDHDCFEPAIAKISSTEAIADEDGVG